MQVVWSVKEDSFWAIRADLKPAITPEQSTQLEEGAENAARLWSSHKEMLSRGLSLPFNVEQVLSDTSMTSAGRLSYLGRRRT
jgi:hypothetical protein